MRRRCITTFEMMSCGSFTRGVVDSCYITATTFLCSLVIIPYVMTSSVAGFIVVNSLVIIEPAPLKDLLHPYL